MCSSRWQLAEGTRGAALLQWLPGQGAGPRAGCRPQRAGLSRGRGAAALRRGRGAARGGAWLGEGAWRPVCAAARAFKPGLARPERAFAAWKPSGPAVRQVPAVPALFHPGRRFREEPRAVHSGMPRYELALILKAMQRVSDLPLRARLLARVSQWPLGRRPPLSPRGREGVGAAGGRRAPAPRGRVGPAGRLGEAACAREAGVCRRGSAAAGGCASHAAAGQAGWRAGGGWGAGQPTGVQWKVRGRTRASVRPRARRREAASSPAPPPPAPAQLRRPPASASASPPPPPL